MRTNDIIKYLAMSKLAGYKENVVNILTGKFSNLPRDMEKFFVRGTQDVGGSIGGAGMGAVLGGITNIARGQIFDDFNPENRSSKIKEDLLKG